MGDKLLKYVEIEGIEKINSALMHRDLGMVTLNGQLEMYEVTKTRGTVFHNLGNLGRSSSNKNNSRNNSRNNSISEGSSSKKSKPPVTPSYEEFMEAAVEKDKAASKRSKSGTPASSGAEKFGGAPEQRRARSMSLTSNSDGAVSSSRSGNYPKMIDPNTLDPVHVGGPAGDGRVATIGGGNGDDPNRVSSAVGRPVPPTRTFSLGEAPPEMGASEKKALLAGLISTLNESHPDYDFSNSSPDQFIIEDDLAKVVRDVNSHLSKLLEGDPTFLESLWKEINQAVSLNDCQIFKFQPDLDEDYEHIVWSFNYFFFNDAGNGANPGLICYLTSTARYTTSESSHRNAASSQGDDFSTASDVTGGLSPSPGNSPYPYPTPPCATSDDHRGMDSSEDEVLNMDTGFVGEYDDCSSVDMQ